MQGKERVPMMNQSHKTDGGFEVGGYGSGAPSTPPLLPSYELGGWVGRRDL